MMLAGVPQIERWQEPRNKIIEEWLVRDNMGLVQQLGLDPDAVAQKQAEADQKKGFSLSDFHANLGHYMSKLLVTGGTSQTPRVRLGTRHIV